VADAQVEAKISNERIFFGFFSLKMTLLFQGATAIVSLSMLLVVRTAADFKLFFVLSMVYFML
jgi:hypothetical protein